MEHAVASDEVEAAGNRIEYNGREIVR